MKRIQEYKFNTIFQIFSDAVIWVDYAGSTLETYPSKLQVFGPPYDHNPANF